MVGRACKSGLQKKSKKSEAYKDIKTNRKKVKRQKKKKKMAKKKKMMKGWQGV